MDVGFIIIAYKWQISWCSLDAAIVVNRYLIQSKTMGVIVILQPIDAKAAPKQNTSKPINPYAAITWLSS